MDRDALVLIYAVPDQIGRADIGRLISSLNYSSAGASGFKLRAIGTENCVSQNWAGSPDDGIDIGKQSSMSEPHSPVILPLYRMLQLSPWLISYFCDTSANKVSLSLLTLIRSTFKVSDWLWLSLENYEKWGSVYVPTVKQIILKEKTSWVITSCTSFHRSSQLASIVFNVSRSLHPGIIRF